MAKKKKVERYNLEQILQVVADIYEVDSHEDDWGVRVIYKDSFVKHLKSRLKKIKQFIK